MIRMPFFKKESQRYPCAESGWHHAFPQLGKEWFWRKSSENKTILPNTERPVEAWGIIGAGIKAYDYMDGKQSLWEWLFCGASRCGWNPEVFRSTVDRFSQEENRMINSWTHGQYMKSFIDPGNTLRLLKASNNNRGLGLRLMKNLDYQFQYTLKDAFGNTSRYHFLYGTWQETAG